jgi:(1->4)-alpha-D-glucan 1-alpha-D-glucosylmutase
VEGPRAAHLVAYARRHEGVAAVTIAGRLWASLGIDPQRLPLGAGVWEDTYVDVAALGGVAAGIDVLTGAAVPMEDGRIRAADAFSAFPGALVLVNININ